MRALGSGYLAVQTQTQSQQSSKGPWTLPSLTQRNVFYIFRQKHERSKYRADKCTVGCVTGSSSALFMLCTTMLAHWNTHMKKSSQLKVTSSCWPLHSGSVHEFNVKWSEHQLIFFIDSELKELEKWRLQENQHIVKIPTALKSVLYLKMMSQRPFSFATNNPICFILLITKSVYDSDLFKITLLHFPFVEY